VVQIRPEAEQKLRAGFQRRVDQQRDRYAVQLAHAEQLAAWFECGEVAGVFSAQAGGGVRPRAYVVGLLPMAAIPVLIAGAAAGIPGSVPALGSLPFITGAWFGLSLWRGREPKRCVWLYAFTKGLMLLDDPEAEVTPLPWSQVSEVSEVWTDVYNVSAEESRPALTAYRLRWADGQTREISRSFQNVRDPYREVGQLLKGLMPAAAGHALPAFPTIDEIIATYAGNPGPHA
jgi:hypothetical protein